MRDDVKRDLSASAFDFVRVVWPQMRVFCGGGELMPVESVTAGQFAQALDVRAGIDAWQIHTSHGIRGIASRVQWGDRDWGTFTVRYSRSSGATTEYEKRRAAIASGAGWLFPYLTIQAYVEKPAREGALLSAAVCRTADLIRYIEETHDPDLPVNERNEHGAWLRPNHVDGNLFWVCEWNVMAEYGYHIKKWVRSKGQRSAA